jgi:CRP/FNR family transcriptional regulator, cyclic AMP receptor protein
MAVAEARTKNKESSNTSFLHGKDSIGERAVYMSEALVEISGNYDILGHLDESERETLLRKSLRQVRKPGEYIFEQGQPHKGIYVIRSGRVRTYYASCGGREITLGHWTAGYFVGGPEIFGTGVHIWSAVAMETCEIAFFAACDLRRLMLEIPGFAVGLVDGLSYAGKCYSGLLQILGTRPARGRLAHLLLTLADREDPLHRSPAVITRSMSHEELAHMIGATRQWVTISLKNFEKEAIVSVEKQRIVILNRSRLQQLSMSD